MHKFWKIFLLSSILIFAPAHDFLAQKYNWGIVANPLYGFILPHHVTVNHLIDHHAYGLELGVTLQTNGAKQWHHDFFFPKIELLAFYGDFGNPEIVGEAFGIEGSIYLPYFKNKGWSFGNKLNAGIGYITKRYDRYLNPKDNLIGSHINCIVNIGFLVEKQFKQQSIGLELSLKHMSNGAYKLPNLGVNVPFLGINYTYYFHPLAFIETARENTSVAPFKSWKYFTQITASVKEIYPTGGSKYGVIGLTNYVQYKIKSKVVLEGGIDLAYDGSTVYNEESVEPDYKNINAGIYIGYMLPIHHLQLMVGMGRYLYNPINPAGMWYHRFGARFRMAKRWWANITIKSHWAKADYFEYGIAYRWN